MTKRSIETEIVHAGERRPLPEGLPNATPVFTSSSYSYESMAEAERIFAGEADGFIYSRYGNPTVAALQESMCKLENGAAARTFSSGMAAIHAALLTCGLTPGSVVLASRDLYGATFALIADVFGPFGVETQQADFGDLDELRRKTAEIKPRVLIAETISNPLLKVLDVAAVAEIAHAAGAKFVVDSTFATPYLSRPLELGADIVLHSATKYLGGHGDAMGGVVVVRDTADEPALTRAMKLAGGILSAWEAHQISRGIHTLALRMDKQCANAEKLAEALSTHIKVSKVHYPKFAAGNVAERVLRTGKYGALVSIVLAENTREAAWKFMDSLDLCVRATTLGDVFTTVSHSATSSHRELSESQRNELGISEGMVRISVGIEDPADILADIEQALS
ncbi:MAG: PLP-dependent aspartate aminotransferase family protein [Acidobacteriota bacterium]